MCLGGGGGYINVSVVSPRRIRLRRGKEVITRLSKACDWDWDSVFKTLLLRITTERFQTSRGFLFNVPHKIPKKS